MKERSAAVFEEPLPLVLLALPPLSHVGALVRPLGETEKGYCIRFYLLSGGNCGFNKSLFLTSIWSLKLQNSESSPLHMLQVKVLKHQFDIPFQEIPSFQLKSLLFWNSIFNYCNLEGKTRTPSLYLYVIDPLLI